MDGDGWVPLERMSWAGGRKEERGGMIPGKDDTSQGDASPFQVRHGPPGANSS